MTTIKGRKIFIDNELIGEILGHRERLPNGKIQHDFYVKLQSGSMIDFSCYAYFSDLARDIKNDTSYMLNISTWEDTFCKLE